MTAEPTESGRASSRPEGACSWTFPGTAESPVAWDLPCPYSFVEDILMVLRKIGVVLMMGRVRLRILRAVEDMVDGWMDLIDIEKVLFMYGHVGVGASLFRNGTPSSRLFVSSCGGKATRILTRL